MLLRKRVRAGILLYALFLAAIFSLLLQFYLNRLQANQLLFDYQQENLQAQLIAEVTKQEAEAESGSLTFSQGQSSYRYSPKGLFVEVQLPTGAVYHYQFAKFLPEEDEEPQEPEKADKVEEVEEEDEPVEIDESEQGDEEGEDGEEELADEEDFVEVSDEWSDKTEELDELEGGEFVEEFLDKGEDELRED